MGNRYNGKYLPDFIEEPSSGKVRVSRTMEQTLPTEVPDNRVPPKSALDILPKQKKKKAGAIDISFKEPHLPIGVLIRSCDGSDASSYALCGLAVQADDGCTCYNYQVPFNLKTTFYLDKIMAWMKLPSRAFMYGQMKYWPKPVVKENVDVFCDRTQEDCGFEVQFSADARVLQWSWFGKVPKRMFTPEGIAVGVTIAIVLFSIFAIGLQGKKSQIGLKNKFTSFIALNRPVGNSAAMRS